ncbi:glycosyl hydrolase 115 family protein [Eubacterium xylanophilum]|uniref:glycosyl hydrolase 115 family protein n=1 Tax=Eubacterium xylanophilum TaxID=39497 RepID=UPI0004B3D647|nr:glycosyl hydrolase 115 family protein [Eubacterium xylanophilum]
MMRNFRKGLAVLGAVAMLTSTVGGADVDAAKKPKFSKTKISIKAGKSKVLKIKNISSKKKLKVKWKSSKKKVAKVKKAKIKGKVPQATIVGVKAGKAVITAKVKTNKKSYKLKCKVTVAKKGSGASSDKTAAPNSADASPSQTSDAAVDSSAPSPNTTAKATSEPTVLPTEEPNMDAPEGNKTEPFKQLEGDSFQAIKESAPNFSMYIDEKDGAYDGISLIAEAFKADVARVTGGEVDKEGVAVESANTLKIVTDKSKLSGNVVIAGTVGEGGNEVINQLAKDGKIDVSGLEGKWERYLVKVVDKPMSGVDKALVVAGSDKRGTNYGIFHLSELMGVSPWVWWADVTPAVQTNLTFDSKDVNLLSKEPSVTYRGIFLNDESPSLTTWTGGRYGGRNQNFYRQVYELLLRLKANYLWPAMWGDIFSENGKGDKQANAKLADAYGIVMGTSHHEPCYRAGNEWGNYYKKEVDNEDLQDEYSSAQCWNLYNVPGQDGYIPAVNEAIEEFWNAGVLRNKDYDNICTVGMRGEADSELPSAGDPPKYADYLNHVITTQKNILNKNNDKNPTQLVIYKEVEDAWYAGKLYEKDAMKGTFAMFCDDNWSYLRTLPTYEQQQQIAGLGMYYHFDYVGAPKSYTWIQTTQLSKVWDQMSVAYDHGINDVWIVNVGDLKPMEMDISYFLDMGYDYEKWGVNGQEKIDEYKKAWAKQQFAKLGGSGLSDEQCQESMRLIDDYLDLETSRKVEHVLYETANSCSDMFSLDNYREAQNVLEECEDIMSRAKALEAKIPEAQKAAFYQLVYYPAMAVPNVLKIQIYAALNNKYADMGLVMADNYAELCKTAIALDKELYNTYNTAMPGGPEDGKKWKGMQSADQAYHIGMQKWNTDSGVLPKLKEVKTTNAGLNVLVEKLVGAYNKVYTSGTVDLQAFDNLNDKSHSILVASKGDEYEFTTKTSADWIELGATSGKVDSVVEIPVSINWSKVTSTSKGTVTISDGTNEVVVNITANVIDASALEANTFVMTDDYATIDISKFADKKDGKGVTNSGKKMSNKMIVVPDNGKYKASVRSSSSTTTYEKSDLDNAPYVEYKVYVPEDGTYNLQCQFNPTSNLEYNNVKLRYGISVDGGDAKITNSIVDKYLAGTWKQGTWATDIEKNSRSSEVKDVKLSKGVHTIRYYQCDPNMALIRMTLYKGSLATVYNSPEVSFSK